MGLSDVGATALLQALPDPALVIRPDGSVVFANAAAQRFLGIEAAPTAEPLNVTEFMPMRERQRLEPLQWLLRWADTPDAPEREFVHLTCNIAAGGETQVRASVGRLDDHPPSYVVVLHDVGAELDRQRHARDAHRIAARVLAISADAVINVGADQYITYVNASAEQLFEYDPGALTGHPLADLIPDRFHVQHRRELTDFVKGETPSRFMGQRGQVMGLTRTGQEIPLEASISKVTIEGGVTFSALLRDLRPRLAVEHALGQSRARFALVFDHAQQAMALLEPDGTVLELNDAARLLLRGGVGDDTEIIGQSLSKLPWWTAESVESELDAALAQCRSGDVFRTRSTIQRDGQEAVELDVSLSPVVEEGSTFAIIAEARELH
jgi:PAS domain S-box-containing protein